MKKVVISTGGKQYLVSEDQTIDVELLKDLKDGGNESKSYDFDALLVIDGEKVTIGTPIVDKVKVTAEVVAADVQTDKVTSIRYKAKKRVHTVRGHRQRVTSLKITKIA